MEKSTLDPVSLKVENCTSRFPYLNQKFLAIFISAFQVSGIITVKNKMNCLIKTLKEVTTNRNLHVMPLLYYYRGTRETHAY
jgi:hypothetical protein